MGTIILKIEKNIRIYYSVYAIYANVIVSSTLIEENNDTLCTLIKYTF